LLAENGFIYTYEGLQEGWKERFNCMDKITEKEFEFLASDL
jgi:hypothetical protein